MNWKGFVFLILLAVGCKSKEKNQETETTGFTYDKLASYFPATPVPYSLTDEQLKAVNKPAIPADLVKGLIPDSIRQKNLGAGQIKYSGLAKLEVPDGESYLIMLGTKGSTKAAYILTFDQNKTFAVGMPFLVPDDDATTTQVSSVGKDYSITRSATRRKGGQVAAEGKDVFVYDKASKQFSWIVTDVLDENKEITSPIDTLPRTNKLSGDYVQGKRNMVSVRDGRYPNQLVVYIHTEQNEGECKGELKGDFIITSPTTAVYRQGGDPCVLQLQFTSSSVTMKEQQGCGNYRDLNCPFGGSFAKKKVKSSDKSQKTKR